MNNDLEDIADKAYDSAVESTADSGASDNNQNAADQTDTGETTGAGEQQDSGEVSGQNTDNSTSDGDGVSGQETGQEGEDVNKKAKKIDNGEDDVNEQKMSDEDFEAEAKRRGFIKPDEREKAEQERQQQQDALSKLNERPEEVGEAQWKNMTPESKLIYKSLPYIETVGKDGQTYRVKDASQLPDDFEFADKKTELRFYNEYQAQEMRAQKTLEDLKQYRQRSQQQTAQMEESRTVVEGVAALQKDGVLPKFTAKPNTPEFDKDPALILVNEILAFRDERRKAGSNLSVEDAAYIYKAQHPEKFTTQKKSEETAADKERKRISSKIGSPLGGKPSEGQMRPNFKGMSATDIADYYSDQLD